MTLRSSWKRYFRIQAWRGSAEKEVDTELQFHIQELVDRYVDQGMSETEARRRVEDRFGEYGPMREELVRSQERRTRRRRHQGIADDLRLDFRLSLRTLVRRPRFSVLAILTLGLGVGACVTLSSVVNSVLLKPLPFPESNRLMHVGTTRGGGLPGRLTMPEFLAIRQQTHTLEYVAAYHTVSLIVQLDQQPDQLVAGEVTEDFFRVFGIPPLLGRAFEEEDFRQGASPVAILSHRVWIQQWGGDEGALGRRVVAHGPDLEEVVTYTIVGVMAPDFDLGFDLLVPQQITGTIWAEEFMFTNWTHSVVGRMADGRDEAQVGAEMNAIAGRLASEYPQYYSGSLHQDRSIGAMLLLDKTVHSARASTWLLFGAAALLLVIAVVNVSGLYLARVLDQRHELAVRGALGAGTGRLARQTLTESLVLSVLGTSVGVILAFAGVRTFRVLGPANFPRLDTISIGLGVLGFSAALALATGVLAGAAPVAILGKQGCGGTLNGGSRVGRSKGTGRLRSGLVGVQISLAAYLLVGSGLLVRSFWNLHETELGFTPENLSVSTVTLPGSYDTVEEYVRFFTNASRRLAETQGVDAASWVPDPPLYGGWWYPEIVFDGMPPDQNPPYMNTHTVGPEYFASMGIPVLRGRGITPRDRAGTGLVAVVDEVAAAWLWPSDEAVGKRIRVVSGQEPSPWLTVVGVVAGTPGASLTRDPAPQVYVPAQQRAQRYGQARLVVRSDLPPTALVERLQSVIRALDPSIPPPTLFPYSTPLAAHLRTPRFYALLIGAFSIMAVTLAAVGAYSQVAYLVMGKTREIGIRKALGAGVWRILASVSRDSITLAMAGLLAGLVLAAGTSRVMESLLFGIEPLDLITFLAVGFVILATITLACIFPAFRATRIPSVEALRSD